MTTMGEAATTLDRDLFCPWCDYNLRGIDSVRCPECGREVDRATLSVSRIPWEHRRQIGRVRAYWRTFWMLLRHPVRFGQAIACPVSYRDAQRFRWVTILMWLVPAALVALFEPVLGLAEQRAPKLVSVGSEFVSSLGPNVLTWPEWPGTQQLAVPFIAGMTRWAALGIVAVFIWLASGLGAWWWHRRGVGAHRRARVVAISRYCFAASLPLLIATIALWLCSRDLIEAELRGQSPPYWWSTMWTGLACWCGALLLWWIYRSIVQRSTLGSSALWTIISAMGWLVGIGLAAIYSAAVVLWLCGFVRLLVSGWD